MKLIDEKVTLVHRRLWPALVAIGRSRAAWQLDGLSSPARAVLAALSRRRTSVAIGGLVSAHDANQRRRLVKELEVRLLVHSQDVHTGSGRHEKELATWSTFRRQHRVKEDLPRPREAQETFERAVEAWPTSPRRPSFPWLRTKG